MSKNISSNDSWFSEIFGEDNIYKKKVDAFYFIFIADTSFSFIMGTYIYNGNIFIVYEQDYFTLF